MLYYNNKTARISNTKQKGYSPVSEDCDFYLVETEERIDKETLLAIKDFQDILISLVPKEDD